MNNKLIVKIFVLLVVMSTFFVFFSDDNKAGLKVSRPVDRTDLPPETVVEFFIGDRRFTAKKKYLVGTFKNHLHEPAGANLWALLPDMEGYDREKNRYEFLEELQFGRRVRLNIQKLKGGASIEDHLTSIISLHNRVSKVEKPISIKSSSDNLDCFFWETPRDEEDIYCSVVKNEKIIAILWYNDVSSSIRFLIKGRFEVSGIFHQKFKNNAVDIVYGTLRMLSLEDSELCAEMCNE